MKEKLTIIIEGAKEICREEFTSELYERVCCFLDHDKAREAIKYLVEKFQGKVTPELVADLAFHCVWCEAEEKQKSFMSRAEKRNRAMKHLEALRELQADSRPISTQKILWMPYTQRQALEGMIGALERIVAERVPTGRPPGGKADLLIYDLDLTFCHLFSKPLYKVIAGFVSAIFLGDFTEETVKDISYKIRKGSRNIP